MVSPSITVEAIKFVSLGMVVLDELRFPDGRTLYSVPGGSGLYSTLGACMASAAPKSVGCLILAGSDFPSSVEKTIMEWDVTLLLKKDIDRLSTRGLLQYRGINFKATYRKNILLHHPNPSTNIYSPNHVEFMSIFNQTSDPPQFDLAQFERCSTSLLDSGIGSTGNGTVVIRCAELGSFVMSRTSPGRWFPAFYHANNNPDKVVDATGAGNAFLGAFALRFGETGDLSEAAIFGSVAASFVIEQIGVPEFARRNGYPTVDGGGENVETWNGAQFSERVGKYRGTVCFRQEQD